MKSCPSEDQLRALAWGQLPDEESDDLFAHVEDCATCKTELASLDDAQDSLIYTLRAPDELARWNAEPDCQRALIQARMALPGPQSCGVATETGGTAQAQRVPKAIGEYSIERPLGQGGMGRVFLAQHSKLGRQVALKILASHRLSDARMRERFEAELRAVGNLSHPNIVAAHDAREIDGLAVLITEFIDGFDLGELVRRIGPLAQADACEIIRQVAVALQYTYEKGFVHRDVKPANIMLSKAGEVKLLDLGLARLYSAPEQSELTATGQAMGTADYIAPEQIHDSRSVDVRADIYALGCTLFKLLTGHAPFADAQHVTAFDKMSAHVSEEPPTLSDCLPTAPESLVKLIEAMLAKSPTARPQYPQDVALLLGEFTGDANLQKLAALAENVQPRSSTANRLPTSGSAESRNPTFWNRRVRMSKVIATGVLGTLFGLCLGVILTIRNPDGSLTIMHLAEGSSVTISESAGNESAGNESASNEPASQVNPLQTENTGSAAANLQKQIEWIPYDQAKLKSLRSQGQPVVLFFTADWDLNGQIIKREIENDPQLAPLIAQYDVTMMLADWTEPSDDILLALRELDSQSVPRLAIYPPLPSAKPLVLRDQFTTTQVKAAFRQALDTRYAAPLQFDPTAAPVDKTGSSPLQFAMLVQPESTGKQPFISEKNLAELQSILPRFDERTEVELNNMRLVPVTELGPSMFPVQIWRNGRLYALVSTDPKYSISWDDIDGRLLEIQTDAPSDKREKAITLWFDGTLGERMLRLTESAIGEQLAFIVENRVLAAPKIVSRMSDSVQITGNFSAAQIKRLRLGLASAQVPTTENNTPAAALPSTPLAPGTEPDTERDPASDTVPQAEQNQTQESLKRLGQAFHAYHDLHKRFPGSSQKTVLLNSGQERAAQAFSWRVAILPFLGDEYRELYADYRFDEPWDSPHNLTLLDRMPAIYRSPHAPNEQPAGHTNYLGFSGDKSALGQDEGVSFSQFGDGTSPTLLLVETKSSLPWTKPEDLPFEDYADAKRALAFDGRELNYLTADGVVHSMSPPIDWELLGKLITRDGGERIAVPE